MSMEARPARIANAGTFACVPTGSHLPDANGLAVGTLYPQRRWGSKFNKLAPQMPERLSASRLCETRQHHYGRAPPVLKHMARHDYDTPSCPKFVVFRPLV